MPVGYLFRELNIKLYMLSITENSKVTFKYKRIEKSLLTHV